MKKVLIITYYWPPSGGAGVQRWLKFAKYLPEFGWEPIIYTAENPETPALDESLLDDIPNGIEVHKLPIWEPLNAYKKFTGRKPTEKLGAGFLSESKAPKLRDKLAIWIRGNLFIPDAKKFWIRPSSTYLEHYLKKNKVDLIISTGPPHSVHMIAYRLKRKFALPWVADFRDPWTEIDFYQHLNLSGYADRKHKVLEKNVLDCADLIVSVGNKMASAFSKKTKTKQIVITNGYDDDDIPKRTNPVDPERFILMHVGSINKDRNHSIFWNALKSLIEENSEFSEKFEFHLIGKLDHSVHIDVEENGLSKWIKILPYVPHSEVIERLQAASVLYLPLNNTQNADGILTGKVFEYFAAKRPILAIGPENGDLGDLLKKTETGEIVNFNDLEKLIQVLSEFYSKYRSKQLSISSKGVENYSRKNLTEKLTIELEKLVHE
ncbi:glycosyltransferase family 4 protein [Sunxiuqinia indica]|uniref:glycosyltransferase family 4 protein n=1 Tax=Sunxiuqinia indica TaxID=2692584 RepID=UPI00135887C4|nr:glycosyltransferase family 4 protein [Sunxiuqinia indica]